MSEEQTIEDWIRDTPITEIPLYSKFKLSIAEDCSIKYTLPQLVKSADVFNYSGLLTECMALFIEEGLNYCAKYYNKPEFFQSVGGTPEEDHYSFHLSTTFHFFRTKIPSLYCRKKDGRYYNPTGFKTIKKNMVFINFVDWLPFMKKNITSEEDVAPDIDHINEMHKKGWRIIPIEYTPSKYQYFPTRCSGDGTISFEVDFVEHMRYFRLVPHNEWNMKLGKYVDKEEETNVDLHSGMTTNFKCVAVKYHRERGRLLNKVIRID